MAATLIEPLVDDEHDTVAVISTVSWWLSSSSIEPSVATLTDESALLYVTISDAGSQSMPSMSSYSVPSSSTTSSVVPYVLPASPYSVLPLFELSDSELTLTVAELTTRLAVASAVWKLALMVALPTSSPASRVELPLPTTLTSASFDDE